MGDSVAKYRPIVGRCDSGMTGSTTSIVSGDFANQAYGNDFFNTQFYLQVLKDADGAGTAPEGEVRQITDFDASTGTFTTAAFSANVEEHDEIMPIHESIALLSLHADATLAKTVDDSIIAHILAVDGDVSDYDDNTMSLEALNIDTDVLIAHAMRNAETTEDLNQAAGAKDLFTGTTATTILKSLSFRNANVDCSDDAGGFTGISIQTDDVTPTVIISAVDGAKANLTEEATLNWTGSTMIKLGTKIQLTIIGDASDATCVSDIQVNYRSAGTGTGTLA